MLMRFQNRLAYFQKYCISFSKDRFCLNKQRKPDEMPHHQSLLFAKVPVWTTKG